MVYAPPPASPLPRWRAGAAQRSPRPGRDGAGGDGAGDDARRRGAKRSSVVGWCRRRCVAARSGRADRREAPGTGDRRQPASACGVAWRRGRRYCPPNHDVFQPPEDLAHSRAPACSARSCACPTCSRPRRRGCRGATVHLGLDLRGGSYLLLEVDMKAVIKERLDGLVDGVRQALRPGAIFYQTLQAQPDQNRVLLQLRDPGKIEAAVAALKPLISAEGPTGAPDLTIDSTPDGQITADPVAGGAEGAGARARCSSRSRSCAGASTRPAWSIRRSPSRATTASWCSCPGSAIPTGSRQLLGKTAHMTFRLVDEDGERRTRRRRCRRRATSSCRCRTTRSRRSRCASGSTSMAPT